MPNYFLYFILSRKWYGNFTSKMTNPVIKGKKKNKKQNTSAREKKWAMCPGLSYPKLLKKGLFCDLRAGGRDDEASCQVEV